MKTNGKQKTVEEQLDAVAARGLLTIIGITLVVLFAFWLYRNNSDLREYEEQKQRGRELHRELMEKY